MGDRAAPRSVTLDDLSAEGARLWRELGPGSVVWLSGELGAGKTTFVQAVAESAHAIRARSPTFALVHQYESPEGTIAHVDCYRLRHPDDARDLDLLELAHRSRLTLIEWPERAGTHAPQPDRHVHLGHAADPSTRTLAIS